MTARPTTPEHLFVYGTLRPGDVRWPFLERFVADTGVDDTADGSVYDTGREYPAAVFGGDGSIIGRTYALRSELLDETLDLLDEVESAVDGLYRRVVITTGRGLEAWAYAYGEGLVLTPIPSGDWFDRPVRHVRD